MAVGDLSFAFDQTKGLDPQALAKRRLAAALIGGGGQQMPQDIGQGLSAIGNALYERQQMQKAAFPPPPAPLAGQQPMGLGAFLANKFGFNNNSGGGLY